MNERKQETPKVCALYARSAQSNPTTISSQIENCRELARKNGWQVSESHVCTDDGVSSRKPFNDRPGFGTLLAAVQSETCPFDCLIVDDTHRLSRKLSDVLSLYSMLSRHGVCICVADSKSTNGNLEIDPLVVLSTAIDEAYSKLISHRGSSSDQLGIRYP